MGAYINPTNGQSKEMWLNDNCEGEPSTVAPPADLVKTMRENGFMTVCLVDNMMFSAAGIAYSDREFEEFNEPDDRRMKIWYFVRKDKLMDPEVSNLRHYVTE